MDTSLINEIADLIASKQAHTQWMEYLIHVILIVIASAGGGYLGTYLKKRGELFALKVDQNEILKQLRASAETTEKIKNEIEKQSWREKELITIKTERLERLLGEAKRIQDAHDDMIYDFLNGKKVNISNYPILESKSAIDLVQKLHFPELGEVTTALLRPLASLQQISFGNEGPREDSSLRERIHSIDAEVVDKYHELISSAQVVLRNLYEPST